MLKRRTVLRNTLLGAVMSAAAATLPVHAQAAAHPLKIGIIGAGDVAQTLGGLLIKAGHPIMLSARNVQEAQSAAAELGSLASAGTPNDAANFGDVVILAVPYKAMPSVGQKLSPLLHGKTLIDATNAYWFRDGSLAEQANEKGIGVLSQSYFPGAVLIRAFNSIDMAVLRSEAFRSPPRLAVPIAGDSLNAVKTVQNLATEMGFDPVLTGGLASATLFQSGHPGFEVKDDVNGLKRALGL
ncbi:NADPH-dependent F420 reductase [Neokomagataea anthophila]|uniref:NAD(P)-binding domain-containing protein n=1 Tax=Neokomagataea anthophila TaxID=2826925 RepID=A0ABS5E3Z0_9PROT|nr:NAD(P)-binding domain-containing protein [Neokomagataea anthophila]MBR0558610.1 NAD(P)-binding domain-containing protein [Neokomagataea anthophila]